MAPEEPLRRTADVVRAGALEIHLDRIEPAAESGAAPVVLLHQGLGSIAAWKDFPDRLARATGSPVIAYDRPGHGRSPAPAAPPRLDFAREAFEVLPAVLEAAGGQRPARLVGHSDGGTIALIHASRRAVGAVVAIAAHVVAELEMFDGIRRAVRDWETGGRFRDAIAGYHGAHAEWMFRAWSEGWLAREEGGWSIEAELSGIAAPVLALQGAADEYGTSRQPQAIARHVAGPVETLLIPDCGHNPHTEQPDAVCRAIAAFLARQAA